MMKRNFFDIIDDNNKFLIFQVSKSFHLIYLQQMFPENQKKRRKHGLIKEIRVSAL